MDKDTSLGSIHTAPCSARSATGHTGRLLRALLCLSLLFLVAHLALQICLYTLPHLRQLLDQNCKWPRSSAGRDT